ADPDVVDLRRRADDHRRRGDRARSGARLQFRHLSLHRQGKGAHRHRPGDAEQYAAVRPARARARRPAAPWAPAERAIPGATRGEPVALAPCQTVDVPYIADAEIVLEAEVLPTGWTFPEGRFGEFTRLMGGLHWNPLVRIKAISMRKDAIY